ncbi:helix-turn-helix domain-containing protein [Levilactobacillus cerevisiae]|uniref:helix-turn-helix domain-containing protein n=1 Tax=Levilactobacillus cerevisiae TaxID=1704076 RepID=UPI000F7789D4|nr:helix-turn-helix transcriptional regulator [Levilactobacillus cerevisiae]
MTTWQEFKQHSHAISDIDMNIIETLTTLQSERIRRGISQRELAARIKMSPSQLASIERLDAMPTLATLNRYAHGLNLQIKVSVVSA